jgi:hypothetical protein
VLNRRGSADHYTNKGLGFAVEVNKSKGNGY